MKNKDLHHALTSLYSIARIAAVNADQGDVRENCATALQNALNDKFPIGDDDGETETDS